ncbi:hypothetical protein EV702DRAFT_1272221 [Suillus placidus]|uniref:Uncharacterized protein n=1 Tax=Suillus placidus TaxID=48579 RepID=A0A9P7CVS4_9AGAM|nr:hypothetical protein EV702DRAFT_1272221 [Suillus placidus]
MSSQPAVRFHEPPVTECNSMEVDDSSESRMSLDQLDAIYLGPDDELDSDSGSSSGRDVLNAIPVSDSTPEPHSASPAVPEAPMTCKFIHLMSCFLFMSSPKRIRQLSNVQSPKPEMAYEDLHAMVREFMPIGSFDHTEHRLGDYEQRHGNLPDPTVAQLLEADRPFRITWAETCDKLRKADADLRRMQSQCLIVETLLYTLPTQYLVHGARWPVLHAQDGTRDSGFGIRDWDLCFRTPNPNFGARDSGLGTRDSVLGTRDSGLQFGNSDSGLTFGTRELTRDPRPRDSDSGPRDSGPRTRDSGLGLGTRDSGLGTRDSGLGTRDSGLGTRDSGLGTRDSGLGLGTRDSGLGTRIGTRDSGLGTRDSGLGTRDSGLGLGTRDSDRDSDSGLGLGTGTRDSGLGTRDSGLGTRTRDSGLGT